MTKRRLVCVTVVAGLGLAVGFFAWLQYEPPPGVNRAAFNRLRKGMTRAEMQATMGGPPQNVIADGRSALYWEGTIGIFVIFDDDGHLAESAFYDDTGPALRERLRAWLGW